MLLEVKLYSELKRYAPEEGNEFILELSSGATATDLLNALKIPEEIPRTMLVDGMISQEDTLLTDGCTVVFFTPLCGG